MKDWCQKRPTISVKRDLLVSNETYYSTHELPYRVARDPRKRLASCGARTPNALCVCGLCGMYAVYTHTHTHTHIHTHTHTHTRPPTHPPTHPPTPSVCGVGTPTLPSTHLHPHPHAHTHPHTEGSLILSSCRNSPAVVALTLNTHAYS